MLGLTVGLLACSLETTPVATPKRPRVAVPDEPGEDVPDAAPTLELPEVGPADPPEAPPPEDATPAEWRPFRDEALGDFLYGEEVVHDFEISLSSDAVADLSWSPESPVWGRFEWGDESWDVGVRLKGSTTFRTLAQKAAFKIDFNEWEPEARFHGLKSLTLNNMVCDPTMVRERAYYWYAARVGIPAPRHAYARVRVNGELFGLYSVVETVDDQLVERVWIDDDDGVLLEGTGADLVDGDDHYEVEEVGEGDVGALVDALDEADDDDLVEVFERVFDEGVLRYWALDLASGNDDGYARNHHNYFLYYAPFERRWSMIPWGTDRSFEDHASVHGDPMTDPIGHLVRRCLSAEDCRDRLDATILDMAEGWEARGLVDYVASVIPLIEEDCERDPRRELGCDPEKFLRYVEDRVDEVRWEIE
ncbi:MAG: CotH kinase family protein [Myxococcota bacterium]